jgi:cation transport ATPase
VLSGASELDESLITGETARRRVSSGVNVYAGSMNYSGALTLKVTTAGGNALIDEIERLLEKATSAKSRAMRLADRASRIYAPVVHVTALLTAIGWLVAGATAHDAIVTAIAVLIITCPCALALAIPAVQVVVSGALFRAGVILNAGDAIERLAEADTVIFDKTGTLTLPQPRVANTSQIDLALLKIAARLALSSRHPLAVARVPCGDAVRERDRRAGAGRARHARRRRGAAGQLRVLRPGRVRKAADRHVHHVLCLWRPIGDHRHQPDAAAGRGRSRRGAARARSPFADPLRRPQ